MRTPTSANTLETFGRFKLSRTFFMRDFLYSEISQMERIPNLPANPQLAIEVGQRLCEEVLEPIQDRLGRISIRSAYRSRQVNDKGAENKNQYRCARSDANRARHIWDELDESGFKGATACIVVPSFLKYYENTKHWQALAWWIHDHITSYSEMEFFPNLAALNISWHERPAKAISSRVEPLGYLTRPGFANHEGSHENEFRAWLAASEA